MLTVAILSYNRPVQLVRCIESFLPLPLDVKVVIYDDKSPRISDIKASLTEILKSNDNVVLRENIQNLGYDANLFQAIVNSDTRYVMLLSDDDILEAGCINSVLQSVSKQDICVGFVRYAEAIYHLKQNKNYKFVRNYGESRFMDRNQMNLNGSFVYNSILFSGLIFNRDEVKALTDELKGYLSSIYIQVAIYTMISAKHGTYFIGGPGVIVVSDGENGFGLNSASQGDSELSDRSSFLSNLKYHKRLFLVIRDLGKVYGAEFVHTFFKEYHFRSISGLFGARESGWSAVYRYYRELNKITGGVPLMTSFIVLYLMVTPIRLNKILVLFAEQYFRKRWGELPTT